MPASEIFIQATETDPDVIAQGAVREAHERLRSGLAELTAAQPGTGAAQPRSADLVDFCLHEVRRYLVTADRDLYAPASGDDETRLLVNALRVGAAALDAQIDELTAADPVDAARFGVMIAATLDVHLRIEESVLLPALAGLPGVDPLLLAADLRAYLAGKQVEQADGHRRAEDRARRTSPACLRFLCAPGSRRGVHPGQQPRPQAITPGVRSHPPRRLQLGLLADRTRGMASPDRPGRCGCLRSRRLFQPTPCLSSRRCGSW